MLPLVLLIVFVVVPIAELAILIAVGQQIGVLWTVALLIADSVLGTVLMRSQGRTTWRRFNEALTSGRPPAKEVLDGALVIFGGAFLLTPGFLTDVLGLLLLLPPTRALLRRVLVRRFAGRMVQGVARSAFMPGAGPGPGPARPAGHGRAYDVDGTARDVEEPRLHP